MGRARAVWSGVGLSGVGYFEWSSPVALLYKRECIKNPILARVHAPPPIQHSLAKKAHRLPCLRVPCKHKAMHSTSATPSTAHPEAGGDDLVQARATVTTATQYQAQH